MTTRTLLAALLLLTFPSAAAETLTFEQALARVESANASPHAALEAADQVDRASQRTRSPIIRVETGATSAKSYDAENDIFRYDALTALAWVDYPLVDGGIRALQAERSRLDTNLFRQRLRDQSDELFVETVDAVARLYSAQERLRVLTAARARLTAMRENAERELASRDITNLTALQRNDVALGAEVQILDAELQRMDAEKRLRSLMNDRGEAPIEILLAVDTPRTSPATVADGARGAEIAGIISDRRRNELAEAEALLRPQLGVAAFGGVSSLTNIAGNDDGAYGLFGVRLNLTLPMFDATTARRVAEARLQVQQADMERRITIDRITRRNAALQVELLAAEKRAELIARMVEIARSRVASVDRLVAAGLRPEYDAAETAADLARRESDLVAAKTEAWKNRQLLARRLASGAPGAAR